MAKGRCVDCKGVLDSIKFCRPSTQKEKKQERGGMFVKRDTLCESCWKAACKAQYGKNWEERLRQ